MSDAAPKVKDVLVACFGLQPDEIKAEHELGEDLGADSLDVVEMWMALEDEFGIEFPDHEVEGFKTVGQVVDYVLSKTGGVRQCNCGACPQGPCCCGGAPA